MPSSLLRRTLKPMKTTRRTGGADTSCGRQVSTHLDIPCYESRNVDPILTNPSYLNGGGQGCLGEMWGIRALSEGNTQYE